MLEPKYREKTANLANFAQKRPHFNDYKSNYSNFDQASVSPLVETAGIFLHAAGLHVG